MTCGALPLALADAELFGHRTGAEQAGLGYIRAADAAARHEGIPVDGHFAWSLMDNFEWAARYSLRCGLIQVDFETQERPPKDSAHFLRSLSQRSR